MGVLVDISDEKKLKTVIKGNLIQAAGGTMAFYHAINEEQLEDMYANLLQIIGNSMEAIAGIKELQDAHYGEIIGMLGGWIQAIGALIGFIYTIREY